MQKVLAILRGKKGTSYIDAVVMVLCVTMAIVLMISVGGAIYRKFSIDSTANEVKRVIEIDGKYDDTEKTKAENLIKKSHVTAAVSCSTSGKIPLNNEFTITLTGKSTIGIGSIGFVDIPLYGTSVGHSEVYWKD